MRRVRILFQIGAWSFILLGMGHLGSQIAFMLSSDPLPPVIQAMSEFIAPLPGSSIDLLSLHNGFSLMMGILLVAVGVLNLFVCGLVPDFPLRSGRVIAFNIGLSALTLLIAIKFFFLVPVVFSLFALVFYSGAFIASVRLLR